jgi:hypothetical protein
MKSSRQPQRDFYAEQATDAQALIQNLGELLGHLRQSNVLLSSYLPMNSLVIHGPPFST